jgi:hypothetical protein
MAPHPSQFSGVVPLKKRAENHFAPTCPVLVLIIALLLEASNYLNSTQKV